MPIRPSPTHHRDDRKDVSFRQLALIAMLAAVPISLSILGAAWLLRPVTTTTIAEVVVATPGAEVPVVAPAPPSEQRAAPSEQLPVPATAHTDPTCTPLTKKAETFTTWQARPKMIPDVPCRGLTFLLEETRGDLALVGVGTFNEHADGAYRGDTSCDEALPVLCVQTDNTLPVPGGVVIDQYHGWVGTLRSTTKVKGTSLTSRQVADALCAGQHGVGYRMAEFHDGGTGWHFWGTGPLCDDHFWVAINDKQANPWDLR